VVAEAEDPSVVGVDQRQSADDRREGARAASRQDGEGHVGEGAVRGALGVVEVEVPVDERETDVTVALAQRRDDADEDAAAAADDEGGVRRVEELGDAFADLLRRRADLAVREDARRRVTGVVADVDLEVAEVGDRDAGPAQGVVEASVTQRRRHETGAPEQRSRLQRRAERDDAPLRRLCSRAVEPWRHGGHRVLASTA